jgi:hypothetical protein
MRILLEFTSEQSSVHRARLEYAFRLFCAIYGHEPGVGPARDSSPDAILTYARKYSDPHAVCLTNGYVTRPTREPAPEPIAFARDGEATVLFYNPFPGIEPDWLAEIFEWASCADEYSIEDRDAVGRIPFPSSLVGRYKLNPRLPYAAVAMRFLQSAIARGTPRCSLGPLSPVRSQHHLVVNTHDVDFLPLMRRDSCYRLAKNAALSLLQYKSPKTASTQAIRAVAVAFGARDPLDQVLRLAHEEHKRGVTASYYFLPGKSHRRDGNYSIDDPTTVALMKTLQESEEMEVGVHGSYCSLNEPDGLAAEFDRVCELGFNPMGSRQHWLRFTIPQLLRALKRAGAAYDCSIAWSDEPGFRTGTCFAFPPYDFEREASAGFLEIPLVIMDRALLNSRTKDGEGAAAVSEVLAATRRYGWGGVSVLWHPTAFGGGQYPRHLGDAFWNLLDEGRQRNETWLSAASFTREVWQRYADAGLLPARRLQ